MTQFYENLIQTLTERYPNDNELESLIKQVKYDLDDEGDADRFAAKKMENYLNNMSQNNDGFIKYCKENMHRYLQSKLLKLVVDIIDEIGNPDNKSVDGRNEYWVGKFKEIRQFCVENDIIYDKSKYL